MNINADREVYRGEVNANPYDWKNGVQDSIRDIFSRKKEIFGDDVRSMLRFMATLRTSDRKKQEAIGNHLCRKCPPTLTFPDLPPRLERALKKLELMTPICSIEVKEANFKVKKVANEKAFQKAIESKGAWVTPIAEFRRKAAAIHTENTTIRENIRGGLQVVRLHIVQEEVVRYLQEKLIAEMVAQVVSDAKERHQISKHLYLTLENQTTKEMIPEELDQVLKEIVAGA